MRPDYAPKSRKSLIADERGSVATIMGLTIIPLMLATGLAADYAFNRASRRASTPQPTRPLSPRSRPPKRR